jgi:hypothetical protein
VRRLLPLGLVALLGGVAAHAAFDPARMREDTGIGAPGERLGVAGIVPVDADGDGGRQLLVGHGDQFYLLDWDVDAQAYVLRGAHEAPQDNVGGPFRAVRPGDFDGDGVLDVAVLLSNGALELYDAGTGAFKSRRTLATTSPRTMAVGRTEGGPEDEIAVLDANGLAVYRFDTTDPLWTVPGAGGVALAVGNVDADPALEIVIAAGDAKPGVVVDAATRAVEWTYAPGFGSYVALGDVDGDGRAEIATLTYSLSSKAQLVDGVTRSPRFTLTDYSYGYGAAIGDLDGDGVPEVLLAKWLGVDVYSASGVLLRTIWTSDDVAALVVTDVEGDCRPDLVYGAGFDTTGGDSLVVADGATGTLRFRSSEPDAPYAFAVADALGDGRPKVVWRSQSSDNGYEGAILTVTDLAHRRVVASSAPQASIYGNASLLVAAQLDDDPQLEIIAPDISFDGRISARDVLTNEVQWSSGVFYDEAVVSLALGDADGDGAPDVAVGTLPASSASVGSFVRLYRATTGVLLWKSPSFGATFGSGVAAIRIADVDGSPGAEILVAVPSAGVYGFDGVTRQQKWLDPVLNVAALEVADVNGDGKPDYVLGTGAGRLIARDGATRATIFDAELGAAINAIRIADLDGDGTAELVVALGSGASTIRVLSTPGLSPLWDSPVLPGPAGTRESLVVADADGDGQLEIGVATRHAIRFFEYDARETDADPPVFDGSAGVVAVAPTPTGCCPGMRVSWGSATDAASPPVVYRVYRGTDPGFTPGPENLVATTPLADLRDTDVEPGVAYSYVVRAVDAAGNEDLNQVVLTAAYPAHVPLEIVTQPTSVSVCEGSPVRLTVAAAGSFLTYQWWLETQSVPVGTQATLSIPAAHDGNAGRYWCVVSDGCSSVRSATVVVRDRGIVGDANHDCRLDVSDVFSLINFLFAGGSWAWDSDVNGDGVVDVLDVFYLINDLFAHGPPPVVM